MTAAVRDERRLAAYLRAYSLFEEVQGEEHEDAAAALPDLQQHAEAQEWDDVAFVAAAAQVLYAIVRPPEGAAESEGLDGLLARAERLAAPAFVALALGLRGLVASGRGDVAALLADVGRSVSLLVDDDSLASVDFCTE